MNPPPEKTRPVIAMSLMAVTCPCCGKQVVVEVRASAVVVKK